MRPVGFWLILVFGLADMAWKVSVVGVVDVLGDAENGWLVESVKLVTGLLDVVFDTITVLVVDWSLLTIKHGKNSKITMMMLLVLQHSNGTIDHGKDALITITAINPSKWVLPSVLVSVLSE